MKTGFWQKFMHYIILYTRVLSLANTHKHVSSYLFCKLAKICFNALLWTVHFNINICETELAAAAKIHFAYKIKKIEKIPPTASVLIRFANCMRAWEFICMHRSGDELFIYNNKRVVKY